MKIFSVSYNIPGCLPESAPQPFDTRAEAEAYAQEEYIRAMEECSGANVPHANVTLDELADMLKRGTLPDPEQDGSGYAWHIEEVDFVADPECEHCDGQGTEEKMGAGGYFAGFCTYCGEV